MQRIKTPITKKTTQETKRPKKKPTFIRTTYQMLEVRLSDKGV